MSDLAPHIAEGMRSTAERVKRKLRAETLSHTNRTTEDGTRGVSSSARDFTLIYGPYLTIRRERTGNVDSLCPFHDDKNPSFWFSKQSGNWLCFAGCGKGTPFDLFERLDLLRPYDYTDERGTLLFQVVRAPGKLFRQRRPDGNGGWLWRLTQVRRVPYRLHDLQQQRTVVIAEGEKDVDRLWSIGIPATCNPGGAGHWSDAYAQDLRAAGVRSVVVIPDNDSPGRDHANAVSRSCLLAGLRVKIVTLPGLPNKGDVSDWLDAGHSASDLVDLERATPVLDIAHLDPVQQAQSASRSEPTLTALADLLNEPQEPTEWLVDGLLPMAGLSLAVGKPKAGKSTAARCLAYSAASGQPWLNRPTQQGPVIYVAFEEKRTKIAEHFRAMGATSEPLWIFAGTPPQDGLAWLRRECEARRPVLVIVDTLLKLIRVRDSNDYAEVSRALEPLLALARETGTHVMVVHHAAKGDRGDGDAVLGSQAILGAVDTALFFKRSDGYRTMKSMQRYGEDIDELTLQLDGDTRTLSVGLSRRDADDDRIGSAILEALRGQALRETDLHVAVEGRKEVKERILRRLVADRLVTRAGHGRRNDPYIYTPSLPPSSGGEGEDINRPRDSHPPIISPSPQSRPPGILPTADSHLFDPSGWGL